MVSMVNGSDLGLAKDLGIDMTGFRVGCDLARGNVCLLIEGRAASF